MTKEWQPDGWVNPHNYFKLDDEERGDAWWIKGNHDAFESGASAMLSALIKWLDEACTEHRQFNHRDNYGYYPRFRRLCPQCWNELRGEK